MRYTEDHRKVFSIIDSPDLVTIAMIEEKSQFKGKKLEDILEFLEREKVIEATRPVGFGSNMVPCYYYVPTNAPADKLYELRG